MPRTKPQTEKKNHAHSIIVNQKQLREAVTGLGKVVSRLSSLPILKAVRFFTDNRRAFVEATDLDQKVIYCFEDAVIEGLPEFIVSLTQVKGFVKIGGDSLMLEKADGEALTITNYIGSQKIQQSQVETFETCEWPTTSIEVDVEFMGGFLEAFRRLSVFASTDDTRPILNGIHIDTDGRRLVATDGRRLCLMNTMNLRGITCSCVVPITKFLTWSKLYGVKVGSGEHHFRITSGVWDYSTKLVGGTYPNYKQVIPEKREGSPSFTIDDSDVQVLSLILKSLPKEDSVVFMPSVVGFVMMAHNGSEDNPISIELIGSSFIGDFSPIGVNGTFFLDAITAGFRSFTNEDDMSPLRSDDSQDGVFVLMPMRLDPATMSKVVKKCEEIGNKKTKSKSKRMKPLTNYP